MFRWLASLGVVLVLSGFAQASGSDVPGTCLRADGVLFGPWTDPFEPACGEDCGPDDDDRDDELCSDAEAGCGLAQPARLELPSPRGPVCLEPGPGCGPDSPAALWISVQMIATVPIAADSAPPRRGTLPGAGPPCGAAGPLWRSVPPETPPPRAPG